LLHLGVSGSWRDAAPLDGGAPGTFVQFRARPEMRDAQGAYPITAIGPGNSNRMVDTGLLAADSARVFGTEVFYVLGPASFQGEYGWATANNVVVGGVGQGDLVFDGGYMQVSYFLTGEHRVYDRRLGRLGSTYIAAPFTPFWFVRAEDGGISYGWGAWELAARYSYLHLNNGVVQGGIETGVSVGLNWYLTNNLKAQFDYLHNERDNLAPGLVEGNVTGFGTRVQFFF
jgi:phosphate-selective porin OprO/OprP